MQKPWPSLLLVKAFDHQVTNAQVTWVLPLCKRSGYKRTWLTPVLWDAFSEPHIGLHIPHFLVSVALCEL